MFLTALKTKSPLTFAALFIVAPVITASAMASSEVDMLTEDDLLVEIPIVSSVTHMEQTLLQAPASVTIIDRQTIQASTAVDITDLFRLVPGFQTYYVNGGRKGVTYHALGDEYPRRLEVKVDGRSVYESLFSAVTWSTIGVDLDDIEYIEVVRGANAAADGSNAFLASINIVTKSPLVDTGLSLRTQMGSAQTRNAALSYSGKIGAVDHRTTLSFRSNDGFDNGTTFRGEPITIDDDSEAASFTFKGLWTPSASDNVEFQIGATESEQGIGEDSFDNREMSYQYQYLNWSHLSEQGNKTQLVVYHNDLNLDDDVEPQKISEILGVDDSSPFWPLGPVPDTTIFDGSNRADSERWDMELRTTVKPADNLRAVTGAAVRYDRVSSQSLFDTLNPLSETSYRAYTNLEWTQSEQLIVNAGALLEDRDSTNVYGSYRLATNYLFSEDHMFRVALNRSFRAPTLVENNQMGLVRYVNPQECSSGSSAPECNPAFRGIILDAGGISDTDIKNEELKSYELGYAGYFMDRALSLDMRLYYEQMLDIIAERRDGYPDLDNFVNIRDNTDTIDVRGIEIQTVYKPNERFLLRAYYSYSDIDGIMCHTSPASAGELCQEYKDPDKYSLKDTFGLMVSYKLAGGVMLSSTANYNSALQHYRGEHMDKFTRVDLKVAKSWDINRSSVDVSLTAQNVGDSYAEFYEHNLFETRYILGFRITLP
jgi:iron complex outermembrane receptor protein